jgi:SAM-dependent methyltransferase
MLTRFLIFLCEVSPLARRWLWRWWYQRLARGITSPRWSLMNYGVAWPEAWARLALSPEDEPDRYCLQLYARVTQPVSLEGLDVVEVGSGRGGGAAFLAKHRQLRSMTGVDFSAAAVALSRERFAAEAPVISFVEGDAEALPLGTASCDAVVNVESSHCYGSMPRFLAEVARILRPGGHFLFADLRQASDLPQLHAELAAESGLELIEHEDITADVLASLQADHARKQALIADLVAPAQRARFQEFAGLMGSQVETNLARRALVYERFWLTRVECSE